MHQKKERLLYIDVAKGLGIITVVLIHIIFSSERFNDLSYIRNYIYSFHMPLFFIISGFCLYQKYHAVQQINDLRHTLYRLCAKFLPCYFIWSILYIFFGKVTNQPIDIMERIRAVITTKGIAPLWFIIVLFMCEFFFIISHKYLVKKESFYYYFFILLVLFTLITGSTYKTISNILEGKSIMGISVPVIILVLFRLIACLTMLYAGYLLGKMADKIKIKKLTAFICALLFFSLMCFITFKTQNYVNLHLYQIGIPFIFILTSFLGSLAVLLFSYSIQSHAGLLAFIGRNSLGIMVLHYIPLKIMEYSAKLAFLITTNVYGAVLLALIITISVCIGILYIIKRKLYLN